jgi:toxin ParE1/3/4
MRKTKMVWADQAEKDLAETERIIAKDKAKIPRQFVRNVRQATSSLRALPESGWALEDIGYPEIREILYGDYRIIYHYARESVRILRVLHGAKRMSS